MAAKIEKTASFRQFLPYVVQISPYATRCSSIRAYQLGTHGDGVFFGDAGMNAGQGARFRNEIACYLSSRTQRLMKIRLPGQRESASADGLHGGIASLDGGNCREH
jgi:hypothetical protein